MQYMLILISEEGNQEDATPEQMREVLGAWNDYTESLKGAGAFVPERASSPAPRPPPSSSHPPVITSSPTVPSRRRRSRWAGSMSSTAPIWTKPSDGRRRCPWRPAAPSRSGPSIDYSQFGAEDAVPHRGAPPLRGAAARRRRAVPAGVRACGRDPDPHPRRLRSRRGRGPGGVRRRPGALAARRGAGRSRRLDHPRGPKPRDRPPQARAEPGSEARAAGPDGGADGRSGGKARKTRPRATDDLDEARRICGPIRTTGYGSSSLPVIRRSRPRHGSPSPCGLSAG